MQIARRTCLILQTYCIHHRARGNHCSVCLPLTSSLFSAFSTIFQMRRSASSTRSYNIISTTIWPLPSANLVAIATSSGTMVAPHIRRARGAAAAAKVFGTTELLEMILLDLPGSPGTVLLNQFRLQRVSKQFQQTISGSSALRQAMCLEPKRISVLEDDMSQEDPSVEMSEEEYSRLVINPLLLTAKSETLHHDDDNWGAGDKHPMLRYHSVVLVPTGAIKGGQVINGCRPVVEPLLRTGQDDIYFNQLVELDAFPEEIEQSLRAPYPQSPWKLFRHSDTNASWKTMIALQLPTYMEPTVHFHDQDRILEVENPELHFDDTNQLRKLQSQGGSSYAQIHIPHSFTGHITFGEISDLVETWYEEQLQFEKTGKLWSLHMGVLTRSIGYSGTARIREESCTFSVLPAGRGQPLSWSS